MSPFEILAVGVAASNIAFVATAWAMAQMTGSPPKGAMLGAWWRPIRFELGGAKVELGPLLVSGSVVFGDEHSQGVAAPKGGRRVLIVAVAWFVVLCATSVLLDKDALLIGLSSWAAFFTLPFQFAVPLNLLDELGALARVKGEAAAVAAVVSAIAGLNLLPVPPLAGYNVAAGLYEAAQNKAVPMRVTAILSVVGGLWCVAAVAALVARHFA